MFAASCDTPEYNKEFADELKLNYPILSDPSKKTAKAYGVVTTLRPLPHRWTIIIGADGNVLHVDKKVNVRSHGEDIAKKLEELGVEKTES